MIEAKKALVISGGTGEAVAYPLAQELSRKGIEMKFLSGTSEEGGRGILEKENPEDYDFRLKDDFKAFLNKLDPDYPVNFLNDCDITGGNSGSPVLNSKGELIGLAFDGNKESLASDASYTPSYNKCVCVDIRYILAVLSRYAHLDRILDELD